MNQFIIIIVALLLVACATTQSNNTASGKSEPSHCEEVGNVAGSATHIKWAVSSTQPEKNPEGWRQISMVSGNRLAALGYTTSQIEEFAKEIYFTTIVDVLEYDVISHIYFAEITCEIEQAGGVPLDLSDAALSLKKCWDAGQKLESKECFRKVISQEIVL